jgi:dTDP-4-dehydrorhamnose 3,5-epimerase
VVRILDTPIEEVKIVVADRIGDARGFFSEVWNLRDFTKAGIGVSFVQDNHAKSAKAGTLRGLHYQLPPMAQGKLVRVTRGAVLDVAVDIRRGAPSFGRHVAVELSAENWRQLWIPPGFAHGYCVTEDGTEVQYKVTEFYSPAHDRGISWDDPALAIAWPVALESVIVSERDRRHPRLAQQPDLFEFGG